MPNNRLDETTRKKIKDLLSEGLSQRVVAQRLGVSIGTVSNVANDFIPEEADKTRLARNQREISKKYREALETIETLQQELATFLTLDDFGKHYQPVKIVPKGGGKGEATAIVCASDWHYEEEVVQANVNGVNEYNLEIAKKRIKKFWSAAASLVDMCRTRSRIDTVVVNLLGDFCNGWIHEEYQSTNLLTPPEAVLALFDDLVSGIYFFAKQTKAKIVVPCVCGNHGRMTKQRWTKLNVETNFDWMLYQLLARWFAAKRVNNVQFLLPQGDMNYIEVYGKTIRITHGDNIRYAGGLGGVHIPLRKAIDNWNTYKRADYNYLGHWHTDLTGEDYRISGSLIGFNEYSIRIKARYSRPSQAFEIQHPRYGATARFPIIVE